ncbi:MAG: NADH-quinone oxidoreductase subunit L [Syntrophorhabdaceae bacterium PtaU1.Bin034]|nr:MAG: NADH-quinone oxidoreductase subunit L [Syntrophorhabdaceae bacterium PtaU1.Bin034]
MIIVITTVSFLIHLYSTGFMKGEEGYSRFFAYMNFFVGSMLVLVLADNLLFLYLGWEGVGLCSYLLIGFWYRDGDNGKAAMKAFVVTRIGDTLLAIGLFILFVNLDTLHVQEVMQRARQLWPQGSILATIVAAMLLGGAVGKSAQLPLQTWLPDAMAGPTPVSALIHAATMVTAGVYLIARTNVLFSLAPDVQFAVAVIGAITLLMAGASALTQRDIKRVLAYSTMSQVGYMFLALGVGAWSAAIFHFMTHAFFKALLFLGAGVVIQALDNEHDIFRMGGLRKSLPAAFWAFLVGAASLSALPLVTAGFYSKDLILLDVWSSARGSIWLWAAGMIGAVLTSLYAFRVVFVVFFGEKETTVRKRPSTPMVVSLFVFSVFSIISGFVQMPENLGNVTFFTDLTHVALPGVPLLPVSASRQTGLQIAASLVSLLGIFLSGLLYLGRPSYATRLAEHRPGSLLHRVWSSGWGFDRFYGTVFVAPFTLFARWNKDDFVDLFYGGLGRLARAGNELLVLTQSGRVRWYVMGLALGAVIFIGIVVFV